MNADGDDLAGIFDLIVSDIFIIDVDDACAVFRQKFDHLHLLFDDVVHGMESIQVLRTDRSNDALFWFNEPHQVTDLADCGRTHLADKDFVDRFEIFSDRSCDAHRRIVRLRCHQSIIRS